MIDIDPDEGNEERDNEENCDIAKATNLPEE